MDSRKHRKKGQKTKFEQNEITAQLSSKNRLFYHFRNRRHSSSRISLHVFENTESCEKQKNNVITLIIYLRETGRKLF